MPLQKQVVDIPIVGGVEGNTEGPLKTKLTTLLNGVYRKRGGVQKRYGTKKLVAAATVYYADSLIVGVRGSNAPQPPETIAAVENECLRFGNGEVTSYSKALNTSDNGQWVYRDQCSEATGSYMGIASSATSYRQPDVAIGNGFAVYTYRDGAGTTTFGHIYVTVVDTASGALVFDRFQLTVGANNMRPRVLILGTTAYVLYANNAGAILAQTLDLTNPPAWSSATALVSDAWIAGTPTGSAYYDICLSGSTIVLAYFQDLSGQRYALASYNAALTKVGGGVSTDANTSTTCIGITADATRIWLAYSQVDSSTGSYDTKYGCFNAVPSSGTLTQTLGPQTIYSNTTGDLSHALGLLIDPASATHCFVIASAGSVGQPDYIWFQRVDSIGTTTGRGPQTAGIYELVSRPWAQGGKVYALFEHQPSDLSGGTLLVGCITDNFSIRPVTTIVPRQVAHELLANEHRSLAAVMQDPSGDWTTAVHAVLGNTLVGATTSVYSLAFTFGDPRHLARVGALTMVSGGIPSSYDGAQFVEAAFLEIPVIESVTDAGAAGFLSAGTYQYVLVREWTDKRGNLHRSAPSVPISITLAAGHATTVKFRNVGMTTRQDADNAYGSPIINVLYRTEANLTTFFRTTGFPPATSTFNDPTAIAAVTYTDTNADSSIALVNQLYTMGVVNGVAEEGVILDNVCPPSAKFVIAHLGRFWLGGTDEGTLWYSKTVTSLEGPAFNEALTVPAFEGGDVTGLASQDGTLIIFKRNGIWTVEGDGNDDTGANSQLSNPRQISTDTGCSDARSIVLTPLGTMFQSDRGIYLLSRSLDVQFIGEGVADKTSPDGVVITSAVLVADQCQVRFTRGFTDPSLVATWDTLVWDYLNSAWSVFAYTDTTLPAQRGAQGACVVNGVYTWLTPAGQAFEESQTTFLDSGTTWVSMVVQTAWLQLAGSVQGYQRVWRAGILADRQSAHGVSLSFETDYDPTSIQTVTFAESVVTAAPVEQLELRPARQRCSAARFTFADSAPVTLGTGQGATLDGISLEFGVLGGKSRGLAAAQKG